MSYEVETTVRPISPGHPLIIRSVGEDHPDRVTIRTPGSGPTTYSLDDVQAALRLAAVPSQAKLIRDAQEQGHAMVSEGED